MIFFGIAGAALMFPGAFLMALLLMVLVGGIIAWISLIGDGYRWVIKRFQK